jgi:hypothetical protein
VTDRAAAARIPRRYARWPRLVGVVAALAAAALVALTVAELAPTLVVRDAATGAVHYRRTVDVGEQFRLEHVHSVTGRRVVETFSVHDRRTVAIEELWFDAHGANLPTGPETIDGWTTSYHTEESGVRVHHHGRPIGTLPLIVGSEQVDHTVVFADGQRVRLLDVAPRWRAVEIAVEGVGRFGDAGAGGRKR